MNITVYADIWPYRYGIEDAGLFQKKQQTVQVQAESAVTTQTTWQ